MKRLVNVRPPLFCAVGLVVGIFSAYEAYFGNYWYLIAACFLAVAATVIFAIRKRRLLIITVATILFIAVGYGLMSLAIYRQNANAIIAKEGVITGRVCDIGRNGNVNNVIYLEDCHIDGVKLDGRVKCAVVDGSTYNTGDVLTLRGTVNSTYPVQATVKTGLVRHNVRYEVSAKTFFEQMSGELKLDEKIRRYVYDATDNYMGDNAAVMYALLTGDRNAMDESKLNDFQSAGIIHLLAVSGLHVGFIVAVIGFVLKRFRLPTLVEWAILLVPLVFYAYVCGFAPSIIRAIVMLSCAYVARAVFGSYDILSSLSVAVIVILCISPLYLFDVGFQLSVLSVYGISTIYLRVRRAVNKRRLPKVVSTLLGSLSLTAACSLSTFFAVAVSYGKIPTLSVLTNLVAIPIVSVAFVLGLFGLIPSIFGYLLWLADKLLQVVSLGAKWLSSLQISVIYVYAVTLSVAVGVILLFVLGEYVNIGKIGKIVTYAVGVLVICLTTIISAIPKEQGNQAFVSYGYRDTILVATSQENDMAIVGSFGDDYVFNDAFDYARSCKVNDCVLYITDFASCNVNNIEKLVDNLPVSKAYVLDNSGNDEVVNLLKSRDITALYQQANAQAGNGVKVQSVYDGPLCGAVVTCKDMKLAVLWGSDIQMSNFAKSRPDVDFAVLNNACEAFSVNGVPTTSFYQSPLINNYGANKYGNFTIKQKDDTITLSFR